MRMVVWVGKQCKLTQQKKATLFAEKINNVERKNKAEYVDMFYKYLQENSLLFDNCYSTYPPPPVLSDPVSSLATR